MNKEIIAFAENEVEKRYFHRYFLKDVDINNILISNKIFSGEKKLNTVLVTWKMVIDLNYYA